ncbi:hypothetical protein [Bdellovibrio sp. HCB288]|uniref:glucosamine inositolphosphorylceramide transferase family protein n=1 Tax=Bdellovibrio sp. HCB288 TaxID=3394355 RepID=UPI0039B6AD6D
MKVGLIVSEKTNSKYALEFIEALRASATMEVLLVKKEDSGDSASAGFIFRKLANIVVRMDERYLNSTSYRGHLNEVELRELEAVAPYATDSVDYLISLMGESVPEHILGISRHGALLVNAAIPSPKTTFAGFWEVYGKKAVTPFAIQLQTKASVQTVFTGRLLTQSSFLLNQAYVSRKALSYLHKFLNKKQTHPEFNWSHLQSAVESELHSSYPSVFGLAGYITKRVFRTLQQKVAALQKKDQHWNVAFLRGDWQPLNLAKGLVFEHRNDQFFADPFVIHKDGRDICFVEEYDYKTNLGHITAFELKDQHAINLGAVIKETFHMSFPYLFEYEGNLYMCPETSGSREIRIYKCLEFPLKWEFEKALMKNIAAVDSLLLSENGKWWMLTNIDSLQKNDNCTELHAFYSDSPLSETWIPHPMNPLVIDPLKARNGGLLRDGNKVYRVSQSQEFGVYGASSRIHEILEMTESNYTEKTIANIKADFFKDIYGTHHLHSNGSVTVFDYCKDIKVNQ